MALAWRARDALVAVVFLASFAGVAPLPRGAHALRHSSRSAMPDDDLLNAQWTSTRGPSRGPLARVPCRGMLRLSGGRGRPQHRSPSVENAPVPVRSNSWNWLVHGGGKDGEAAQTRKVMPLHPGVELRANRKSISHRCHLFEVAFVWQLTKETIHLPLGCLQGGNPHHKPLNPNP